MPAGIKVEGLANLNKLIEQLPVKVQRIVDAELTDGALKIASLAKQLAPKDEGGLTQAITPDTNTFLHKEVTCNKYYAPYMEFGTGRKVMIPSGYEAIAAQFKNQAKRGSFEDMVNSLEGWLKRHGGNPKNARFMAIMILKNGLKPRPFFFKAYNDLKRDIENKIISKIAFFIYPFGCLGISGNVIQ